MILLAPWPEWAFATRTVAFGAMRITPLWWQADPRVRMALKNFSRSHRSGWKFGDDHVKRRDLDVIAEIVVPGRPVDVESQGDRTLTTAL